MNEKVNIQLVEPHNHHDNVDESSIKTAKYHMISGLEIVDKICPLRLWQKIVPQIQDTPNMLHTLRRNATISAFKELEGPFEY